MTSSSTAADALSSVQLLIAASETFMGAARILRMGGIDGGLNLFYADVTAYCALVNSRWKHMSMAAYEIDASLIYRTLDHLESIIAPEVLDSPLYETIPNAPPYEKLRAFNQHWERIQKQTDNDTALQYIRSSMKFGTNVEERGRFIQILDRCENELRERYPDNQSYDWAPRELSINTSVGSSSIAVWSAAQSIFKAFVACSNCNCTPTHDISARLRLGTYRKHNICREKEKDECFDFDMFLSLKQDWKEARVFMLKEIKESVVQIQSNTIEQPKEQEKATNLRQMRVKQLCEPIERLRPGAYRLKLKVTGDQIFKLQSESSTFLVDRAKSPITLEQVLRSGSHHFTERTKRILAVMLSYAVLYLHDTPWLQPTWSSSHVLFLPASSSCLPLQPFIQAHLASHYESSQDSCTDPDDLDPDDFLVHHCPLLVTLAMMLMELYFYAPFDILAKRCGVDLTGDAQSPISTLTYLDVNEVFKACKTEMSEGYHYAVEKCLDSITWEDEDGDKLDSEALIRKIYQEVVIPLETELSQAFSKISSDGLDEFAKGINMANWGQNIQQQGQTYLIPPSIKIAILDTGIDIQHPHIDARRENIRDRYNWLSDDETANLRLISDRSGHGTFAASLILDYAPDAQLYVAKIADDTPSKPSVIAKAINYAVSTWEVDIISMSFGFPTCSMDDYHELEDALANAHAKRVLLFAAASNCGGRLGRAYPARDQNVIAIHATDTNGNRSRFSPTALSHDINLATVGEAIESAWPMYLSGNSASKFLRCKSGTSFATPIAAGIAAFLLLYTKIHLPDKADALKSRRRMQALLKRVAEKEVGQMPRDGYHFIDLSLHSDSLFGRGKNYIDETIRDVLNT
ncbi:peptidase S8/S53 domain-containing protein [Trichoderma sp. SZMC 28012]